MRIFCYYALCNKTVSLLILARLPPCALCAPAGVKEQSTIFVVRARSYPNTVLLQYRSLASAEELGAFSYYVICNKAVFID